MRALAPPELAKLYFKEVPHLICETPVVFEFLREKVDRDAICPGNWQRLQVAWPVSSKGLKHKGQNSRVREKRVCFILCLPASAFLLIFFAAEAG